MYTYLQTSASLVYFGTQSTSRKMHTSIGSVIQPQIYRSKETAKTEGTVEGSIRTTLAWI